MRSTIPLSPIIRINTPKVIKPSQTYSTASGQNSVAPCRKLRIFLLCTGFLPYFAINLSVAMLSGDVGAPYTCENLSSRANSHPSGWRCRVWGRRTVLMGGSCAMWRVRTGSGPGGSSPKDSVACAAGVPGRSRMSTFHLERLFQRAGAWPLS